jgi:predicted extracellular nuclease
MKVFPNTPQAHAPMAPRAAGQERIVQMNAHNLFDTVDDASKQDPVYDRAGYKEHVGKLAVAIRDALGAPDIITMQEVENMKVLKDLVADPAIKDLGYVPILKEGTDPRGIDNAILYRPGAVQLDSVMTLDPQFTSATGRSTSLFTRPPLVATFKLAGAEAKRGVRELTVIANHFTSKLGREDAARKRQEQASVVADLALGLQAIDRHKGVVVTGDLNMERSEPEFAPLRHTTRGAALKDATAAIPSRDRFSWRDGQKHVQFDHVLLSKGLAEQVATVVIPHVSTRIEKGLAEDPVRAEGYSDHDPVVTTFDI